jgi:hypothetical protein
MKTFWDLPCIVENEALQAPVRQEGGERKPPFSSAFIFELFRIGVQRKIRREGA